MKIMEDNEEVFVASEHDRLVSAVSKLDKTQHITAPSRNEPTNLNTEFNLVKSSNRVNLLDAVKLLEDTAHHVQISKKLKATQNKSQVLPKPLEKPQAERIKRETGYVETKKKIGRWDAVVARSRTVDFQSFPLKNLPTKRKDPPTKHFLSKLKLKSQLEMELEEVDPPVLAEEDKEEEEQTFPMTYQEMLEHRQHLAKLRAKESYKAAKAKRQSKIKSKKYHRILKKERLKQQLKEFEELQVKNPEEALKKLEEMEKVRALERHTLRHKNTGKWAKSKLVRAKYDKEVRQQLAEQLSVSRSLTHKAQDTASTDDEGDSNEVIPDLTLSQDPLNPWMMKSSDKSNVDEEFNFGYKKYLKDRMYKRKEASDSESDAENTEGAPTDKDDDLLKILKNSVSKMSVTSQDCENSSTNVVPKKVSTTNNKVKKQNKIQKNNKFVATTTWIVDDVSNNKNEVSTHEDISETFDSFENSVAKQVELKLNKLRRDINNLENISRESSKKTQRKREAPTDNLEYLKLKNQKVKAIIDEPLTETNKDVSEDVHKQDNVLEKIKDLQTVPVGKEQENTNADIDPNKFIKVKPKYLNTALPKGENGLDQLDDDEQVVPKVDIEEVFEEDDVVASFRQEKKDEINADKPEEINLMLPGWGSWGGKGVKAPKRKRNRFIAKPAPKMPRRDENKGDVIIMETKDPKLSVHKITDVPFPFTSVKDYEASIRAPLGNTFVPESAHQKLIKPSVITRAGTVIEPMDEEELLMPRNKCFKNESVIKLLAKK